MNNRFFLLALFALSVFTSCKKDLKDIIADTKQATVTIYTYDEYGAPSGSGSGFFINESGMGITNYHVLDGSTKAIIKTSDSIEYEIDKKTKKLTYRIVDLVLNCNGASCGSVYAVDKYGFLCIPRNITERLVEKNYKFEESDAWLDLWCHTVSEDPFNAFSFLSACVQYKHDATLTLETLGKRWGWEKTKVWRFFKKYRDVFYLHRLPGSYGCLIFNRLFLKQLCWCVLVCRGR